jgi:hypothetical protein
MPPDLLDPNITPAPEPNPAPNLVPPNPAPAQDSEALKAAVEKARLEERAKLRETIEGLTTQLNSATTTLAEAKRAQQSAEQLLETLRSSQVNGTADVDLIKLTEKLSAQLEQKIQAANETRFSAIEQENKSLRDNISKRELAEYRRTAIEAVGAANLIEELVTGSSPEEIDSSILRAKAAHERIVASLASNTASLNGTQPGVTPPSVPPVPDFQGYGVPVTTTPPASGVKGMSLAEYKLKREELLKTSTPYGGARS